MQRLRKRAYPDATVDHADRARGGAPRAVGANLLALGTSQGVTWLVTLAWTVVVPRRLGPEQMGLLTAALAATSIVGVVLGLPTRDFLTRQIVAAPQGTSSLLATALWLRLLTAPVVMALSLAYGVFGQLGDGATAVVLLSGGATVCLLVAEPALALFQATERMHYLARFEVLSKALQGLGGIAIVLCGAGVVALTGLNLAVAGGLALLALRWLSRQVRVDRRTTRSAAWGVTRASAPYWSFGVFYVLYLWIDSVLLSLLAPVEVVGWYGVATKLFTTLMFIPVIFSTAFLPRLVGAAGRGIDALHEAARTPLEIVVVLSLPICVGTAMSAGDVVPLLYGEAYRPAVPVLVLLSLCFPLMYVNIMMYQVLIAEGRPGPWVRLMALATVVNPALNIALVPVLQRTRANGAEGAALSLVLTELLIVALGVRVVGARLFTPQLCSRLGRAVLAALSMLAVMAALRAHPVPLSAAAGVLTFLAAGALLRALPVSEVRAVLVLLRRRSRQTDVPAHAQPVEREMHR